MKRSGHPGYRIYEMGQVHRGREITAGLWETSQRGGAVVFKLGFS